LVGAVDGRDDLAVVDEKYEVLPHAAFAPWPASIQDGTAHKE
jgi:hypothetical protein